MSFNTALSGLNAATADLGVISNNISNSNTTGFKSSRAEFSDLFSSSVISNSRTIGSGTQLAAVAQQFKQGSINATSNPLDLAINGSGFFRLNNNGSMVYTRAGSFELDREGYIVNNAGLRLTGYQADSNGKLTQTLGDLQLNMGDMAPQPTSQVKYGLNLDAKATAIDMTKTPFDPTNSASYNYTTSATVFDSLGTSHTLTSYFVKADATKNDWQAYFTLDGGVPFDTSKTPSSPTIYPASQPLSFDNSGVLTSGGVINLTGIATGNTAAKLNLKLDFSKTTQFGGQFSTTSLEPDGFANGQLTGVDVENDGTIFGRYSNGQSKAVGQVALVNFQNAQGLCPIGDTNWAESSASGAPLVGAPGSGSLGTLKSSALEGSSVDLTQELVNMINAQRNFQANAQALNTFNSMTQTIINLR
jgi:flagellar hook protein FlgE